MKENIKIGLIGVIALTLIVNTFFMDDGPTRRAAPENNTPQSNVAANPAPNNVINPITPNPLNVNSQQPPAPAPKLSDSRAKTGMKFTEMNHDFGNIQQDTKNTKVFKFTNTGSEPLIIEDAKGSCGCTVPKFPKEPILPGASGEIEVVYSPGKQQGAQTKNITITANTDPITTVLNISANVEVVGQ
jgi:type IV secretory pathway VirB10-like protein